MVSFAFVMVLGALPAQGADPLVRAQNFYERARYEKALEALGPDCGQLSDVVACEKIRAFCHTALGDELQARAAFDRLLMTSIDATLGPEVSPKLQALFGDAKRAMLEIGDLELERPLSDDSPVLLEVRAPLSASIDVLTAFVRGDEDEPFIRVPLDRQGDVFSGRADVDPERLEYYFVARLTSGVDVGVASEKSPRRLSAGPVRPRPGDDGDDEDDDAEDDDGGGLFGGGPMPDWAFWGLIGGGAAVVVAVTVGIIVAAGGDEGTVNVRITFEN